MGRRTVFLTIDLEDYRRQELRDHRCGSEPAHPYEVERQLEELLEILDSINTRATFLVVGRLAKELAPGVWGEMANRHSIGCHGHEHLSVRTLGPKGFARDLQDAKAALEDSAGRAIVTYRAPYFDADDCDPWFGEILARAGFVFDSSRRLRRQPSGFFGAFPLAGSGGAVWEVPLATIGPGRKRLAVIGGTYFRLLPLSLIVSLMEWSRARDFRPMVYLHPYDIDSRSLPLDYGRVGHWWPRLGDQLRRSGRSTTAQKLRALARIYDFRPIESMLGPDNNLATGLGEMSGLERGQIPSSIDLDSIVIGSPD